MLPDLYSFGSRFPEIKHSVRVNVRSCYISGRRVSGEPQPWFRISVARSASALNALGNQEAVAKAELSFATSVLPDSIRKGTRLPGVSRTNNTLTLLAIRHPPPLMPFFRRPRLGEEPFRNTSARTHGYPAHTPIFPVAKGASFRSPSPRIICMIRNSKPSQRS